MKISFNTPILPDRLNNDNGYGYATDRMLASLSNLGYDVSINDPSADVGICFNQPHHWKFYGNQYRVGYHPWESTKLKDGWADIMNKCDEVWTPSPVIADWYTEFSGVTVPVYVYEHGVDPVWQPKPRVINDKVKFLHVGSEAARKGGSDTMKAFSKAFRHNTDVELNLKIISKGWNIGAINRINIINERMSLEQLIQLYHDNHVYVYPSYGEGFGLTPLQAMSTGMPTITVPQWAPYAEFLDENLSVNAKFSKSPWPVLHPGNMLKPSEDELIDALRWAYSNYGEACEKSYGQVEALQKRYDWDTLTKNAFQALESRLRSS